MYEIDDAELPVRDAAASAAFFAAAFGGTTRPFGPDDVEARPAGGAGPARGLQGDAAEAPAAPLAIVRADDVDRAQAAVEAAGGVVTVPAFGFPGGRRFHFREPGGCEPAVWCPSPDS